MTSLPGRPFLRRVWRRLEASPLQSLAGRVRLLPRTLRAQVSALVGRLAIAIGGSGALAAGKDKGARSSWGALPGRWTILPRSRAVGSKWPDPPDVDNAGSIVRSV